MRISSNTKRITANKKVSFKEVLFSRAEGTSAKIPLALPLNKPLPSILLEALLFSKFAREFLTNLDYYCTEIWNGTDRSFRSSVY